MTVGGDYPFGLQIIWLAIASPFIAIGVLFGRARSGAVVGILIAMVVTWIFLAKWFFSQ